MPTNGMDSCLLESPASVDDAYRKLLKKYDDVRLVYRNISRPPHSIPDIDWRADIDHSLVLETLHRILDTRDMQQTMDLEGCYKELDAPQKPRHKEDALTSLKNSLKIYYDEASVKKWNELECIQEATKVLDKYPKSLIDAILEIRPDHGIWTRLKAKDESDSEVVKL
ncbi:hypothetical protein VNI00_004148 [Paramarasmius palmivorus]|uniref:Uncharacterized protein n=1 Tax=Paramarasmius palmivorus TaxID=297713 RepID=A0AAW0DMV8_9AGAR